MLRPPLLGQFSHKAGWHLHHVNRHPRRRVIWYTLYGSVGLVTLLLFGIFFFGYGCYIFFGGFELLTPPS